MCLIVLNRIIPTLVFLQGPLMNWLKVNFSQAFSAWIHLKALRVFTESVLRYVYVFCIVTYVYVYSNANGFLNTEWLDSCEDCMLIKLIHVYIIIHKVLLFTPLLQIQPTSELSGSGDEASPEGSKEACRDLKPALCPSRFQVCCLCS